MSTPDPQLDSIRWAFDAASDRLYRAKTMQEAEDELSNVLHQLYRLGELCRWRLGQPPGTNTLRQGVPQDPDQLRRAADGPGRDVGHGNSTRTTF